LVDVTLHDFARALVAQLGIDEVERGVLALGEQLKTDLLDRLEIDTAATRHGHLPCLTKNAKTATQDTIAYE
jgi:hypothetical protein